MFHSYNNHDFYQKYDVILLNDQSCYAKLLKCSVKIPFGNDDCRTAANIFRYITAFKLTSSTVASIYFVHIFQVLTRALFP